METKKTGPFATLLWKLNFSRISQKFVYVTVLVVLIKSPQARLPVIVLVNEISFFKTG